MPTPDQKAFRARVAGTLDALGLYPPYIPPTAPGLCGVAWRGVACSSARAALEVRRAWSSRAFNLARKPDRPTPPPPGRGAGGQVHSRDSFPHECEVSHVLTWSLVTWSLWGLLLLVLELVSWRRRSTGAPFRTLSETYWWLQRRAPWLRLVVIGGLAVLSSHLAFGVP